MLIIFCVFSMAYLHLCKLCLKIVFKALANHPLSTEKLEFLIIMTNY